MINNQTKTFSTFLHEYIHFLQNFTTTSGLYSSGFYTQFIKYAIEKIKSNPEQIIQLPLELDNSFNRESIIKLNSIYLGQSGYIRNRVIYNNYSFEDIEIDTGNNQTISPKKYIVNFTNTENFRNEDYHFGIIALKEFVAHKIQNKFHEITHPDIPYLIADLIINKELPELENNDNIKILLCDFSLMTLHPAHFFFHTIERLKALNNKYPKHPDEFYKFIFKDLKFQGELGTYNNQILLFKDIYNTTKDDYINLLRSPIFSKELSLLLHVMKNAYELRIKNPTFMIHLINDKGRFTIDFRRIIKNIGTPFFMNNNSYGGFVPPKKLKNIPGNISILLASSQILNNIYSRKSGCSLYDFCSNNFINTNPTNNFCNTNPFNKMLEAEACTFSQLCKTWGIHIKTIRR